MPSYRTVAVPAQVVGAGVSIRDMTSVPDRARVRLTQISSRAYEHPADRSALVALRKLTGFDTLLKLLNGLFNERAMRLNFLASGVKVSERQFPHIHEMLRDGAYVLDMDVVPELFVTQTPLVNAMALGTNNPFIVLNTGVVDLMDAEELRFIIGHELGHVLSGHAVYRTMLYNLILLAQRIAWMPIGYIGLRAIIWGLEEWYRKSELSCDRAGLLAGQDIDAARRALMKTAGGSRLAEMNADAFHEQAHEYDAVPDLRDSLLKLLQLQGMTHPFAVVRFAELDHWATSGEYERILAGDYPRRDTDRTASVGEEIRAAAKAYQDSWSRSEDPLIGMVRGAAGNMARAGSGLFDRLSNRGGGGSSGDDN
jgi:Zn-dependent protease with chaperone function